MQDAQIVVMVAVIAFLIFSLAFHETAHAWVAYKLGDPTAKSLGRITLNPIPHIDPVMTVLLPVVLYITIGFPFGGAKPVPVYPPNFRHPLRDNAIVAFAGPLSNFVLAIGFLLLFKVATQFLGFTSDQVLPQVLEQTVIFNLLLAAFNLIPIPPLDGSRVMTWLLPAEARLAYVRLEGFGLFLIFGLLYLVPGTQRFLWQLISGLLDWAKFIVSLGGIW